jgi:hypothetical protein
MVKAVDSDSTPPDFASSIWANNDKAFARAKTQLADPDLAAAKLFEEMRDGRLRFGVIFRKLGPNRQGIEGTSLIGSPKFLVKYKFKGFLISDDGMHVQLWPRPGIWRAHRLFLFFKCADLDRLFPIDAQVADVRIVDVHVNPINSFAKMIASFVSRPSGQAGQEHSGPKVDRVRIILQEKYPPDGMPGEDVKSNVIEKLVTDEFKLRGWGPVTREPIDAATKRGRYKKKPA